jgi:hypothetical protein
MDGVLFGPAFPPTGSLANLTLREEQFLSNKPESEAIPDSDVIQEFLGDPTADGFRSKPDKRSQFIRAQKYVGVIIIQEMLFRPRLHLSFTFAIS